MPVSALKAPAEIRHLIRRLHPQLKRKVRAALTDILWGPAEGKRSKRSLMVTGACQ